MTDPKDHAEKTTAAEVFRIQSIVTGDTGKQFRKLVRTISFSTRLNAEDAAIAAFRP